MHLSPIEIKKINVSEDGSTISIVVDDENYPTVLGKRGMNARLNGATHRRRTRRSKNERVPSCNEYRKSPTRSLR